MFGAIKCLLIFLFMEEKETWLPIPDYKGRYMVSNLGRVRSIYRESKYGKRTPTGTILKPYINRRGYYTIKLARMVNRKKIVKTRKVHRLVCAAFHKNPKNKPQVNHKDLNQLNNRADNLEWATAKENTNHAQRNGRPVGKRKTKRNSTSALR